MKRTRVAPTDVPAAPLPQALAPDDAGAGFT